MDQTSGLQNVLHQNGKRAWIIADMDSTLVERPPSGLFPTLTESPCMQPILEWLQLGGGVCVVTTAARRSITQIWECVPRELRAGRALVLSALEGGDLVYGDDAGDMVTDDAYQKVGAAGGRPTCFSPSSLEVLLGYAESMIHAIYVDMLADRAILKALSTKYHDTVSVVLERLATGEPVEALLSRERLTTAGSIMTKTGERIISFNTPLQAEPAADTGTPVCTVSVMGFPGAHSKRYYEPFVEKAAALGADLSAAPNSLWFTPSGVSKATPISWLQQHAEEYGFDLHNAVAFGDCPHTNDGPLTSLSLHGSGSAADGESGSPAYCPFVSVADAQNVAKVPAHVQALHVGGLEFGTARVLQGLLGAVRERTNAAPCGAADKGISIPALLPEVVQRCQQASLPGTGEAIDGREV